MKALLPGQCRTEKPQIQILLFTALQTQTLQLVQQGHASTAWSAMAQGTREEQCEGRTSHHIEMAMRALWLLCISLEPTPTSQPILQTVESTRSSQGCLHPFANCAMHIPGLVTGAMH